MAQAPSDLVIDPLLLRRYEALGPRYGSYPAADRFVEAHGEAQVREWFEKRRIGGASRPLALQVELARTTMQYLVKEAALLAPLAAAASGLDELVLRSAPASEAEARALLAALDGGFGRHAGTDCWAEMAVREAHPAVLACLGALGFSRLRLAARNAEPAALHRAVGAARAAGFACIELHLAYALTGQTLDRFGRLLEQALVLAPERLALQPAPPEGSEPKEKALQMLTLAVGRLARAGYAYQGLGEFTQPSAAQRHPPASLAAAHDRLALGVAGIGQVGPTYYQNERTPQAYRAALDAGRLPVSRGIELTLDDLVRRAAIDALACHFRLSIEALELAYHLEFARYFAVELAELARFRDDGLVELAPDWIVVTAAGRVFASAIAAVFDRYARERRERAACAGLL